MSDESAAATVLESDTQRPPAIDAAAVVVSSASDSAAAGGDPPSAVLLVNRPVRLTNRQKDIVRALACLMWADGNASPSERRIIEQVIDELGPSKEERVEMTAWLDADCSALADLQLEQLSEDEKQILLTHAVLLSLADDVQLPTEKTMLAAMIERTAIAPNVIAMILEDAHEDRAVSLPDSALVEHDGE